MRSPITKTIDWFFGRGEFGVTVPAMDGALRPNDALDRSTVLLQERDIDNVTSCGGRLFFSSHTSLFQVGAAGTPASKMKDFGQPITAMAASPAGTLAVALANGQVLFIDGGAERQYLSPQKAGLTCITAMCFAGEKSLLICNGATDISADRWVHDLMSLGCSGSLWRLDCSDATMSRLANGLAWPAGVVERNGKIFVSEAWRHRIVEIAAGRPRNVITDLPGYPARMVQRKAGTLLCVFAPRSQLIEFVLRERIYCDRMIREVPPAFWVAPALFSGRSYLEPLQGGSVKQLGILKPWAPTRSYGLIVELDGAFEPVGSHHSRADGAFHGITSVAVHNDAILATSRAANALLTL